MKPPIARKIPKQFALHGDVRTDDYYWMRDREDPRVVEYLEAENAYTDAVMEPAKPLEEKIYDEILGRIRQTDLSVPVRDGTFFYYTRTEEGKQYPIWCRKRNSLDAPEEVLLDGNLLAEGLEYFSLGGLDLSEDHNLLAYSVDNDGSERFTIHVKNLTTGELLEDTIPNTSFGLNWAGDNLTLFYSTFDETHRPDKVHRHVLGTDVDEDEIVFTEADPQFTFEVHRTLSKRFLIIDSVNASRTSETHFLDAYYPEQPFRVVEPRRDGIEYYVTHHHSAAAGDRFLIRTNEGAPLFQLMSVPVDDPSRKNWSELVAERPEITLDSVDAFARFLVLETRERGLPRLQVCDLETQTDHYIEFPEPAYTVQPEGNREYDTTTLRFVYTSLITPASVFDYDMVTQSRELKKQTEVLGGYDPESYQSERVMATTTDGKQVPISMVYRAGLQRNGQNPTMLYAYGSYGLNSDPVFSHSVLSLLDRGFIYAIAHIRGGAEYGRSWFEEGRMLHKRNTFSDFISCGEHLIRENYTSAARMAAMGGSAGGLLMGAVSNMRPDLVRSIVARVPFVDVVTTMLDPTIPLTTGEYDQWGNPEQQIYYDYMKSYSPYDNVTAQAYPNLLITTGLNDPRVAFWEPAKWTAKLRAIKTDNNLLLLKTNLGAGHGGPSGRYEQIRETAFIYSFLLFTMGILG